MESVIQILLSWQFLMLCLGIAAVTFVFRKIFEYFIFKHFVKIKKLWSEVILPILPVVTGGFISEFAKQYPYPEDIQSDIGKVFFGIIAGMFSGLVYRIAKSYISKAAPKAENNQ